MLKLVVSRRYPFVNLVDIGLRRQVEYLRVENDDLRSRLVVAQQEKATARSESEDLRKQKERLRAKIATLKHDAESQKKVVGVLESKIQILREEIESLQWDRKK